MSAVDCRSSPDLALALISVSGRESVLTSAPASLESLSSVGKPLVVKPVTEGELPESERQFHELLRALPAAIYTTDAAGHITFYNEAAVELSGRRPTLGDDKWCVSWRLFLPDGTPLPHDGCPMAIALRENRAVRGTEVVAERPDGTRVPFIPYPTPLRDATGALVGAVNMLIDISQQKEAETRQRVLFTELNHRLKNNMQMLHGLLASATRESGSPEARAALSDAAQRVSAMAAAQKVLYRANNASAFRAKEFMASVCDSVHETCGEQVTIRCESVDAELSNNVAMPLALIINELCTNAAKYGVDEQAAASIAVTLSQDGDSFVLCVADAGPGFELEAARRRSSGLGLVRGLAGQMGGHFLVEHGKGARCIVRFPADRDALVPVAG